MARNSEHSTKYSHMSYASRDSEWVEFNAPFDTIQVISEAILLHRITYAGTFKKKPKTFLFSKFYRIPIHLFCCISRKWDGRPLL